MLNPPPTFASIDQFQAQIHLIGNISIWYSGTAALFIYLGLLILYTLRRRRLCFDLAEPAWNHFVTRGAVCMFGYLFNFVPYFLVDKPMFLHNYLPALIFKILLLCIVVEHLHTVLRTMKWRVAVFGYNCLLLAWLGSILYVFVRFSALSYGNWIGSNGLVTAENILELQWKNTWDFILHADL